jgi:hypothetical protein
MVNYTYNYAFEDCNSLEVLQLPKKLKELGSLGLNLKSFKIKDIRNSGFSRSN